MTSIYSKPIESEPSQESVCTLNQNQFDVDLLDKIMKEDSRIFPFFFFDKSQLLQLNGIDLPSQLKLLESYDVKSKLTSMPGLHDFNMDENLIRKS